MEALAAVLGFLSVLLAVLNIFWARVLTWESARIIGEIMKEEDWRAKEILPRIAEMQEGRARNCLAGSLRCRKQWRGELRRGGRGARNSSLEWLRFKEMVDNANKRLEQLLHKIGEGRE
ncbi:hypothetical protein H5T88_02475 [bacterium]|nr:hypothetical protein [bacterium]